MRLAWSWKTVYRDIWADETGHLFGTCGVEGTKSWTRRLVSPVSSLPRCRLPQAYGEAVLLCGVSDDARAARGAAALDPTGPGQCRTRMKASEADRQAFAPEASGGSPTSSCALDGLQLIHPTCRPRRVRVDYRHRFGRTRCCPYSRGWSVHSRLAPDIPNSKVDDPEFVSQDSSSSNPRPIPYLQVRTNRLFYVCGALVCVHIVLSPER